MQKNSTKLPLAASLLLASFAYASLASVAPAASTLRPQQSSAAPAPATSSAAEPSNTAAKKKKSSKKHKSSRREPTQKAPTPQRISEIQSALARGGYYQGAPNGKWDSNTVTAMQKFQSDNGLSSSGKIDAPSLQKLGLGSGTAGVDAPKPIAPPASAASGTSSAAASSSAATPAPAATTPTSASSATPKPQH